MCICMYVDVYVRESVCMCKYVRVGVCVDECGGKNIHKHCNKDDADVTGTPNSSQMEDKMERSAVCDEKRLKDAQSFGSRTIHLLILNYFPQNLGTFTTHSYPSSHHTYLHIHIHTNTHIHTPSSCYQFLFALSSSRNVGRVCM